MRYAALSLIVILPVVDALERKYNSTAMPSFSKQCFTMTDGRKAALRLVATSTTCISFLPAVSLAWKHQLWPTSITLAAGFFFSVLYHIADSLKVPLLGFKSLLWHQLDNIFSIGAVGSLLLHITIDRSEFNHLMNVIYFAFNLRLQIRDPWNIR
jgi:hypothetical protein